MNDHHIPAPISPERGREEMRALVAILTAGAEMLAGQLTPDQYADMVGPVIADTWPVDPLEAIPALTAMSLRMATWVAEAYDLDGVQAVLRVLAAEIDPPNLNQG
ncbi:hypothetical protein ACGFJT_24485 [Actinomadura geliboluensis]|uniref:hypothetical protein n=1 Tax=Actinomadura geliboluensis TaxID=882440 RepID=UPI00371CFA34